ncbi:uberolysin/carnocyclin family circular bacteriocin [Halobacillus sp. B23F22_1]|uniref:uberolysin/carnocyclin family circular bacteriocin n=1 Tax=Halobacillus sp. B23F22_1 TaxID=3459514 RepID=UPI00373E8443
MQLSRMNVGVFTTVVLSSVLVLLFGLATMQVSGVAVDGGSMFGFLATKLGVTQSTASAVINMVNSGSTILTIVSVIAGVSGAGLLAAGGISGIKYVIKKRGTDAAAAW